jgi:hypothetical protein
MRRIHNGWLAFALVVILFFLHGGMGNAEWRWWSVSLYNMLLCIRVGRVRVVEKIILLQ